MNRGEEDYLRTILELESKEEIKSISIAKELKITKASVSEMLRKLDKKGLIEFKPYSNIKLTNKGRKIAQSLIEKHKTIERFAEKLGHKNPHDEAHNLEHSFSKEMLTKLGEFLEEKKKISPPPSYIG